MLDWLAVILPTLLTIGGVFVSLETPKLESSQERFFWRASLVAIGVIASVVTAVQQHYSHLESGHHQEILDKIADAIGVERSDQPSIVTERIINRLETAERKINEISNPPRDDNAIYLGREKIAVVKGAEKTDNNKIEFSEMISVKPINFGIQMEFGKDKVVCHSWSGGATGYQRNLNGEAYHYTDVWCEIMR